MIPSPGWDLDGAAESGGLFGLPHLPEEARVRVLGVPYEATVSYGAGTAEALDAVMHASKQVELHAGPWREGVALLPGADLVRAWNDEASRAVAKVRVGDSAPRVVDAFGELVRAHVDGQVSAVLKDGAIPAVLGGDHSVAVGAVHAAARRVPGVGLLHIDAHADLRDEYEGFHTSHACAVRRMLEAEVAVCVSVGLRDTGARERAFMEQDPRVHWWEDEALARRSWAGEAFPALCDRLIAPLPSSVWITWDIDGLDPSLCPGTGTPVPGGLTWREAMELIAAVRRSGRTVLGFDLVEVGPSAWDANVGARLLWALAGLAVATHR